MGKGKILMMITSGAMLFGCGLWAGHIASKSPVWPKVSAHHRFSIDHVHKLDKQQVPAGILNMFEEHVHDHLYTGKLWNASDPAEQHWILVADDPRSPIEACGVCLAMKVRIASTLCLVLGAEILASSGGDALQNCRIPGCSQAGRWQ